MPGGRVNPYGPVQTVFFKKKLWDSEPASNIAAYFSSKTPAHKYSQRPPTPVPPLFLGGLQNGKNSPAKNNMKTFFQFLNEMYSITVGEHPESGDYIYAHTKNDKDARILAQVKSSTLTFNSKHPPGPPGSLVSDHEHGQSHMNKLEKLR